MEEWNISSMSWTDKFCVCITLNVIKNVEMCILWFHLKVYKLRYSGVKN